MSWTVSCTQSSEFKVENPIEVKEVLRELNLEVYLKETGELQFFGSDEGVYYDPDAEVIFNINNKLIGVASDTMNISREEILADEDLKEENVTIIPIDTYLQNQLLEGNAITITCVGFNERSAGCSEPFGDVTIITKNNVEFLALDHWASKKLEELGVKA